MRYVKNLPKVHIVQLIHLRAEFHEADIVSIPTSFNTGLVGRILAKDIEVNGVLYEQGTVLTQKDVDVLKENTRRSCNLCRLICKTGCIDQRKLQCCIQLWSAFICARSINKCTRDNDIVECMDDGTSLHMRYMIACNSR